MLPGQGGAPRSESTLVHGCFVNRKTSQRIGAACAKKVMRLALPLASCRSLSSTTIALLLVILVRSLKHQGWRDLRWLDRAPHCMGGGTSPFDGQWGWSYLHPISQEPLLQKAPADVHPYLRMTRIGLLF
jgi:hypothetical protein